MIANSASANSSAPVVLPSELSDPELLNATRRLVGRSNELLAALLVHLGEVEARGAHRTRACSSLYAYCIYELRLSEDEAFRRVAAARLVRRFPTLRDAIAAGELHLTGLLMLGPHLTEENLSEVLARAKHRTKKEISGLVRQLDPLPDVPARIEPLGPALARLIPPAPTWSEFARALNPVRELTPGDRPRDWVESADGRGEPVAPPAPLEPQRYKVEFTANDEYVKLVEEAKALLSHSTPRVDLVELQLCAMRSLVAELKRKKRAATKQPRKASPEAVPDPPRQRGRHVPAAIRRAVFERDKSRCTYADASGQRCRETHRLEMHHLEPFARGGEHSAANLTLRCRAHNALAAEHDFGKDFVQIHQDANRHEPWSHQGS
jgi:hypothetical protein